MPEHDHSHTQSHTHADHSHAGHSHAGHSHDHAAMVPDHLTRSFVIGICLNFLMVIIGAAAGFIYHSLALLSDAGHNLSDVASLLMALAAIRLAKVKANERFTYGYKKTTILTSLINALILLGVTVWIIYESVMRLKEGVTEVKGTVIAIVAFVGIITNSLSAYLFLKDKEKDLNVKGAYMHLAADALVSFGVVLAGILIYFTKWFWLDPVISILISVAILVGTWSLLVKSLKLTIDAVPDGVDMEKITASLQKIQGIKNAHHVHVWALSTTENALTAHLVIDPEQTVEQAEKIKSTARHALQHLNISHITLEIESSAEDCLSDDC